MISCTTFTVSWVWGAVFTEPIPYGSTFGGMQFESVTATDRDTVVFNMKEPKPRRPGCYHGQL